MSLNRWFILTLLCLSWVRSATGAKGDYNSDGVTDLVVYDTSTGRWFARNPLNDAVIFWNVNHGYPGAEAVGGDFNGDGEADLAVYDPRAGRWYIRTVAGQRIAWGLQWGFSSGEAAVADFNGDGTDDLGIYDTTTGRWYVRTVSGQVLYWSYWWGFPGCEPAPAAFDGIVAKPVVFDDKTATFYLPGQTSRSFQVFGPEPEPVIADFDGDNTNDLAIYEPEFGWWRIWKNEFFWDTVDWGFTGGAPVAGDFDGDGRDDFAVYAKGLWYIRSSTGETLKWKYNWGGPTLFPVGRRVPNAAVDRSTLSFIDTSAPFTMRAIAVEDLERGATYTPVAGQTIGLQPGWHRVSILWYGSAFFNGSLYLRDGFQIYTISAEARRTYRIDMSGGAINIPFYTAPTFTLSEK